MEKWHCLPETNYLEDGKDRMQLIKQVIIGENIFDEKLTLLHNIGCSLVFIMIALDIYETKHNRNVFYHDI